MNEMTSYSISVDKCLLHRRKTDK